MRIGYSMVKPKQSQIKKAAHDFVTEWKNRGEEDKDYVEFWEDLLEDVFGVPKARKEIEPQSKVKFEGTTKRIDIRIKTAKIVIEQKSNDVNLDLKQKQSGKDANGNPLELTPMEQAIRYYNNLDKPDQGRYVVVSNFREFRIWDSYHKNSPVKTIALEGRSRIFPWHSAVMTHGSRASHRGSQSCIILIMRMRIQEKSI